MKNDTGNKVMLGIFVIMALTLFIAGIYFIGQKQRLFSSTFKVTFICGDVNGLQVGNNVRFSGINVGTVSNVKIITDSTVLVDLVLDKGVKKFIKKDAEASVGSEGLMGDKIVNIAAGSSDLREIENNDTILCGKGSGIEQIMTEVTITAENAAQITSDLSVITGSIREGKGTIGKLFMDTGMATNIDKTIINAKNAAGGLSENMEAAKHNILLRGYFKKKEKEEKAKENQKDK
jgi:phospholipid/cholesterol/gamma-HCH transport system substrate-binding protein